MNLLTSIHRLRQLRNVKPVIAAAALESRTLHINYLSAELAIFSMFDCSVSVNEKEAMARTLLSFRHQWIPGEMLIDQVRLPGPNFVNNVFYWQNNSPPSISLFVSGRSFLLFEVMGLGHDDLEFLSNPVNTWNNYPVYKNLSNFVTNLKVVNDPAER